MAGRHQPEQGADSPSSLAAQATDRVVRMLEQSKDGESYLRSINAGYPAAEVWAQYSAEHPNEHWIGGLPISSTNRGEYERVHQMDCPGCALIPFTMSPRSETYWST